MVSDRERLLAQFQKPGGAAAPEPVVDADEYLAFKVVDRKQRRVLVQPVGDSCEFLPYQYLLRIVLDPRATRLALIFSFMAVTIKGRNLRQVAEGLAEDRCEYVMQFDAKRWKKPTDPEAALVEAIEFVTDAAPATAVERESEAA